ncbi:MAG: hypothetical protein Q7J67_06990 [bacterium]|nr:hypothetical protein [bacterium]
MEENKKDIFFLFNMDCERIKTESWMNDGCTSWEISEKAIRGMAEVLESKGVIGEFMPTSDVAKKQKNVFLEMKKRGHGLALQFHADSFRDLKYTKHLGFYNYEEQKEIISLAKQDWEDALGIPVTTFRTGYNTANDHTMPVVAEIGFNQISSGSPGEYYKDVARNWVGLYPYPHHCSSKSRLICGDLELYNLLTPSVHPTKYMHKGRSFMKQRLVVDRMFSEEIYKDIIISCIEEQLLMGQPIKVIQAATHNTFDYLDKNLPQRKVMEFIIDYTKQVCKEKGLNFVPSTYDRVHQEADKIDAF